MIIIPQEGQPVIRAGCFVGTVEEFVHKAKEEDKLIYVKIVPLLVENL
jgi:hypothetical protein